MVRRASRASRGTTDVGIDRANPSSPLSHEIARLAEAGWVADAEALALRLVAGGEVRGVAFVGIAGGITKVSAVADQYGSDTFCSFLPGSVMILG